MEELSALVDRAQLLIQSKRPKQAEELLGDILANDPDHINAMGFMIEVKTELGKLKEAELLVNRALGLYPDFDHFHYQKAMLQVEENNMVGARKFLKSAITIDPENPHYYTLLAGIYLDQEQYEKALKTVSTALEYDPKNSIALSTKSAILTKLNRRKEAKIAIDSGLEEDADNTHIHTIHGKTLIENNKPKEALDAFMVALELDPTNEEAKNGMIVAVKANYLLFRWYMRYILWMSSLPKNVQLFIIFGALFIVRIFNKVGDMSETLRPVMYGITTLYIAFAISLLIITPLTNFILRFNRYGRMVLSDEERKGTIITGGMLVLSFAGLLFTIVTHELKFLVMPLVGVLSLIPIQVAFQTGAKSHVKVISGILMLLGIIGIKVGVSHGEIFNGATVLFFIGIVGFSWFGKGD